MTNFSPFARSGGPGLPTPPKGETIARYETYLEAQRAVDFLSDNAFPVHLVTIVGTRLQMVERVTGRLTYPRVAMAGAASGAWFGLLVGLMLSLFSTGTGNDALVAAPLFGAAFGMLFLVTSYMLTGGRRDFTSTSQIVAGEYAVLCQAQEAGHAREVLARLPGGLRDSASWPRTPSSPEDRLGSPPVVGPTAPAGPEVPSSGAPTTTSATPVPSSSTGGPSAAVPAEEDHPLTYGEAIAERRRREREELERRRAGGSA